MPAAKRPREQRRGRPAARRRSPQGVPCSSNRLRWMCVPVPTPSASCSGANETRRPSRRATSRTTSLHRDAAVGGREAGGGRDGNLELALAVLGQEAARARRPPRAARPSPATRTARRRRWASSEKARGGRARATRARTRARTRRVSCTPAWRCSRSSAAAQERAAAGIPVAAVDLGDVAQHQMQRRDAGPAVEADARGRVGQQPHVAGRAPRVRLGEVAERPRSTGSREPSRRRSRDAGRDPQAAPSARARDPPRSQVTRLTSSSPGAGSLRTGFKRSVSGRGVWSERGRRLARRPGRTPEQEPAGVPAKPRSPLAEPTPARVDDAERDPGRRRAGGSARSARTPDRKAIQALRTPRDC